MSKSPIQSLDNVSDVRLATGLDIAMCSQFETNTGLTLPTNHRTLLLATNGITVFDGYFRVFGVGSTVSIDACLWNDEGFWKFAWNGRVSAYWCFAETAWGDQYAYSIEGLRNGDESVYFLEAHSMEAEQIASTFNDFWDREFVRCALSPYDAMIVSARNKFGRLDEDKHLVYVPSPLLGGLETIECIQVMDARSAMICNGDLFGELNDAPDGRRINKLIPVQDEKGRNRIRIEWS